MKKISIMAHQILGYPNFETNEAMIRLFQQNGVDMVELQIPFSEPIADGPTFLLANQAALERGTTVDQCFAFAEHVSSEYDIPFVIMTYYNVLYQYGVRRFVEKCASIGIQGLIVPDAFPEESELYLQACRDFRVDPILLATPYTPDERLAYLAGQTGGMLYCVARKGVTGARTMFDDTTSAFLARVRQTSAVPIGVGFGIQHIDDIQFLIGKCDVAIIGSHLLNLLETEGLEGVGQFLAPIQALVHS
ncbi:tryptophan synthase subunit alpha [Paenibacillus sp. HN-1]|nr:tryptophan synthase subunit alpha [Paenibacillus sp. CGMCC 1.18879]MBY9083134.1 tryptophan synthase subunit alpha [Paenibacillus sinensis]